MPEKSEITVSLESREIHFTGELTHGLMREVREAVIQLFEAGRDSHITLMMNSGGGDVDATVAFYELVMIKKIPLRVVALFSADSAAIVILCAGKERCATASTTFSFHPLTKYVPAGTRLSEEQCRRSGRELSHSKKVYCDIVARATGKDPKAIAGLLKGRRTLDAEAAKTFGLIGEIVALPSEAPVPTQI